MTMAEYIDRAVCLSVLRAKANVAVLMDAAPYFEKAAQMLEKLPAADVAPVVRCKDCKHSTLPSMHTQIYGKPGTLTCHNRKSPCNNRNVASDYYCKQGERNTET